MITVFTKISCFWVFKGLRVWSQFS